MLKNSGRLNTLAFALVFIFISIACQFDTFLSDPAYAQTLATELTVDHFVGSRGGVGTRDARGSEARFIRPESITGNSKYLFLYDSVAFTIRRIDRATGEVTTANGQPLIQDGAGSVRALWADENHVYIAKRSAILRLTIATGEVISFAGSFAAADLVDGVGEQARFRGPYGLWGNGQFLYVLDVGTFTRGGAFSPSQPLTPSTIRQISLETREVRTIPIPTVADVSVQPPPTMLAGDQGVLYLGYGAANLTFAIGRYTLATGAFERLAGFPLTPQYFAVLPRSLWLDGRGSLYFITDENNGRSAVRRMSIATGDVSTLVFQTPRAVVESAPAGVWGEGNALYIADGLNTVVSKLDLGTMSATIVAGLPSTALGRTWPRIATDSFINDAYPSEEFAPSPIFGDGLFIYGIVRNAIYRVSIRDRIVTHIAGLVAEIGSSDGIGANARFNNPSALWSDGRYLYVGERDAVRRIDLLTRNVIHLANISSRGLWGDSQFLYVSRDFGIDRINLATRAVSTFFQVIGAPGSLWGDRTFLFVMDDDAPNSLIYKIALNTGAVTQVAVFPNGGVGPGAVWGQNGSLFLATARTVRSVDLATGEMKVIAGDARVYGTEDGVALNARFASAHGLWGDGRILYVADDSIRKIEPGAAATRFDISNRGGTSWTTNRDGALTISYGRVQTASGNSPDGVAVFRLRQNGVLISETAVPASALIQSGRMYVEINGPANTGIAIANPNDQPAEITFYFTGANGENLRGGAATIAPNAQVSAFMDQAPFNGAAGARTFTFTSSVPVGAIVLRGLVNERSEFLMTTLPIASQAVASTQPVVLPHFAVGGGWSTRVLLVNPSDILIAGTLHVLTSGGLESSTVPYRIAARASETVDVAFSGAEVRVGSIRIESNAGNLMPIASTVFSFATGGVTVAQNGVAQTGTTHALRLFVEASGRFGEPDSTRTGIAIANPGGTNATVNFDLTDLNGVAVASSTSLTIPSSGQVAMFLHEIQAFSNLPTPFEGILRITTTAPAGVSAIGIRGIYNERGDFLIATMPYVDEEAPAAGSERVFAHIVNGDGYTTQFILISRTSTTGEVRFVSQSGDPLR